MAGEIIDLSAHTYEDALKLCELVYQDPTASARIDACMTEWAREKTWDSVMADWIEPRAQQTEDLMYKIKYGRSAGNGYVSPIKSQSGNVIGYETTQEAVITDSLNSNMTTKGTVSTPMQTAYEVVEGVPQTTFRTGVREAGTFVFGDLLPAVAAVSTGIALGKKISQTAYDNGWSWGANVEDLDRALYENLTVLDPLDRAVFKALWGIDESTGSATAYLDEDAFAYMSMVMAQGHFFDPPTGYEIIDDEVSGVSVVSPVKYIPLQNTGSSNTYLPLVSFINSSGQQVDVMYLCKMGGVYFTYNNRGGVFSPTVCSLTRNNNTTVYLKYLVNGVNKGSSNIGVGSVGTLGGHTYYYTTTSPGLDYLRTNYSYSAVQSSVNATDGSILGLAILFGESEAVTVVPGVTDQTGATTPTGVSGWDNLNNTKNSLRQQYPDMYDNAKHYDYTDENGNNKTKTYLPIPIPDSFSDNGTTPTSGNSNQDRTGNTILNIPETLIELITKIINQIPSPNTPSDGTPTNAPPTGSGGSPTVVAPTGSASSLWKIYNPTQAQLDSFGAWLWSSDFVDQIKKLFNDPMQGIIGVHKVFATPSVGGTANIKVGYLDSGVASSYVTNQYTSIDCGSVSLSEYFGNVFDYSPYTRVSLYLPFIGIVDLDVADVMRSNIKVKYHVDVLSGACLADVIVTRDGFSPVMYQYSGSAIVTYPVSSGTYLGALAGVAAVATGAIAGIMTGGVASSALAVAGTATGLTHLHANVSHSGGFSGCAGAMASKKPYIIISRPQTAMASNYGHFTGKPANSQVILSNCSGFTKVKSVYVHTSKKSTSEEKAMIEAELKRGVLI